MKTCVTSYSFAKHLRATKCSYVELCDKVKEMGFAGIEFTGLLTYPDSLVGTDLETAAKIRQRCEELGLEVVSYAVGADLTGENADEELEKLLHNIDVAEAMGAKVLRHDVCYKLPQGHLVTWQDMIPVLVPRIRKATEYAASKGIRTCTENHGRIFQAPERVEALIQAVGSDNYGWLCDIGNFMCVDADPVKSVMIAAKYAFHVHAKDNLLKPGTVRQPVGFGMTTGGNYMRGTTLGHGVVPVDQCIRILKNNGYDGYVSIEFEGKEECLPAIAEGLAYLRGIIEE